MEVSDRAAIKGKAKSRKRRFSTRRFRFRAQVFSLAVSLWIGFEFYLFVRYLEAGGNGFQLGRPPGVEGYLPISGLISLRDWVTTGVLNTIHPASLIIVLAIILIAFVFKKAFCSWVCPVGFVSEMIAHVGDRLVTSRFGLFQFIGHRLTGRVKSQTTGLKLPKLLDWPLRSLKYLLLSFFLYAVFFAMSSAEIAQFIASPYNKIADIKMMKFFTEIDAFALWTVIILFALSIFLRGFWCRYLCPYGALLGIFSLAGPARIRRDESACISCGKCAAACPSFIKVDTLPQVTSDECSGCLDCVDVCPAKGALELGIVGSRKRISRRAWAFGVVLTFWGLLFIFKLFGPWQNTISTEEYIHHTERMNGAEYNHPGRR